MRSAALLGSVTAALIALGCAPPPAPPAPPVVVAAPEPTVAPEPPPKTGPPVIVPQRMSRESREVDLSGSGKLVLAMSFDGLHVLDAETGVTRGVLAGCADDFTFTADDTAVVSVCREKNSVRVWDLATDTARDIPLSRPPRRVMRASSGGRVVVPGEGRIDVIDVSHANANATTLETGARHEVTNVEAVSSGWIAATDREAATLWNPAGKLVRRVPKSRDATAYSLASSGRRLALADAGGATIIDVLSGKTDARITPCGEASIEDIEWTDDEESLVVACASHMPKSPARVIIVTPEGAEVHELLQADRGRFVVRPREDRVALLHDTLGVVVFDLASGRETHRLAPPIRVWSRLRVSRDLDRALFRQGSHTAGITVVDRARDAIGPRLRPEAIPLGLGRVGDFLSFQSPSGSVYVDPIKDEILRHLRGDLSPDGATFFLPPDNEGFDLADRHTKERRRVPATKGAIASAPQFSTRGTWVAIPEGITKRKDVVEYRLRLVDAKTGKEGKSFVFGPLVLTWSWSPDDTLIAVRVVTPRGRDGKPCARIPEPACSGVRIFEARSGRPLAFLQPPDGAVETHDFLPDGKHILLGDEVYDVRTGKSVWTRPRGVSLTHLSSKGVLIAQGRGDYSWIDPATGKSARELSGIGEIHAITRSGAFLLATPQGSTAAIWDTATWTSRPTALKVAPNHIVILSEDARFAHFIDGGDLVTHRIVDGRSIRRALPALDFTITDEGVFDPIHAASGAALVRSGPDVTRSPMGPLSLMAERFARPGLYADFIAGRDVGPKPAVATP